MLPLRSTTSAFLPCLLACSASAIAVMTISSRVSCPTPACSKVRVLPSMRAMVRPRFLSSTKIIEREGRPSRFQYQVDDFFFMLVTEVGWNDHRLCSRELDSTVSRPLMLSSMSEVVMLWKRIFPRRALVLQRVTISSGLLERNEGMWTASREMERIGMLVSRSKTSPLPRRIGVHGIGPANARYCVGDRSWGLECGGSGSGWIWGLWLA
jgi:hypothetical protein